MSPVLHRELIMGARDPVFAHLRWIAGGLGLATLAILVRWIEASPERVGGVVFRAFHLVWCPFLLMAGLHQGAPTLVRERAQGTLGLLFLTSMHPFEVVAGKAAGAMLRVLILWLAGLPMSAVPVVLGAVSYGEILLFATLNLAWAVTGIGVGLVYSASAKDPSRGVVGAWAMAVPAAVLLLFGWGITAGMLGGWPRIQVIVGILYGMGVSIIVAIVSVGVASTAVQRRWREEEAPQESPKAAGDWTAEEIEESMRVRHWRSGPGRELRSRRPLAWLRRRDPAQFETYVIWFVWTLVCWVVAIPTGSVLPVWLGGLIQIAGMGVQSSSGYRPEVLSGAMELLLTTPLPDRSYFGNRIGSLAREHGLACGAHMLATMWVVFVLKAGETLPPWATLWPLAGLVVAPLAGMVAAGCWHGAIPAALATVAIVTAAPLAASAGAALGLRASHTGMLLWGGMLAVGIAVGVAAVRGHRSREFVLRLMRP